MTKHEIRIMAARELGGDGPATRALDASGEVYQSRLEMEELAAAVDHLRTQLACREQDLQLAKRAHLEAKNRFHVRCEQVVRRG